MGVLNCDRTGCENIMCDRYSDKYGYICWECFNELVAKKIPVGDFMHTVKEDYEDSPYTEKFYDKIFELR